MISSIVEDPPDTRPIVPRREQIAETPLVENSTSRGHMSDVIGRIRRHPASYVHLDLHATFTAPFQDNRISAVTLPRTTRQEPSERFHVPGGKFMDNVMAQNSGGID